MHQRVLSPSRVASFPAQILNGYDPRFSQFLGPLNTNSARVVAMTFAAACTTRVLVADRLAAIRTQVLLDRGGLQELLLGNNAVGGSRLTIVCHGQVNFC